MASVGAVSNTVQVQLIVLCSRYQGYESSPAGCTITFSNISQPSAASTSQLPPSPVSFEGSSNAVNALAASPVPQALSPLVAESVPQTPGGLGGLASGVSQRVTFAAELAMNRPVVGAQSLQSLAGMMYAEGVVNGRSASTSASLTCLPSPCSQAKSCPCVLTPALHQVLPLLAAAAGLCHAEPHAPNFAVTWLITSKQLNNAASNWTCTAQAVLCEGFCSLITQLLRPCGLAAVIHFVQPQGIGCK